MVDFALVAARTEQAIKKHAMTAKKRARFFISNFRAKLTNGRPVKHLRIQLPPTDHSFGSLSASTGSTQAISRAGGRNRQPSGGRRAGICCGRAQIFTAPHSGEGIWPARNIVRPLPESERRSILKSTSSPTFSLDICAW